ncbi:MAG: hypothetical protein K0S47_971 [Herbinix sp.]|jgi:uncharacterized protein YgiM (DUF1202 family)|nr:hypothetical protein [Herbinix sp.]
MKNRKTLTSIFTFLVVFCITGIMPLPAQHFSEQSLHTKTVESIDITKDTNEIVSYSVTDTNEPTKVERTFEPSMVETKDRITVDNAPSDDLLEEDLKSKVDEENQKAIANSSNGSMEETNATTDELLTDNTDQDSISVEEQEIDLMNTEKPVGKKIPESALYSNIGISIASSFVNIRKDADTNSEILGKLYKNAAAEILKTEGDWYYVESGSVKGYVKSEFIKTGLSDNELIQKYGVLHIKVDVDGLNVRKEPEIDSDKVTLVYEGETFPVDEELDEWVKVNITDENKVGYVAKEFVDLVVEFEKAISKEEEQEILKLQAEARAAEETMVKYRDEVNYSAADLKLLACLVHSEAGTQSYEGKLAVANVVLNRVKSSKYPDTIKDVIYQRGQFSVAASGSLEKQLNNFGNYSSKSQKLSIEAAKASLEGANNIGNRLYFHSYKAAVAKGYDQKSNSVKLDGHLFW